MAVKVNAEFIDASTSKMLVGQDRLEAYPPLLQRKFDWLFFLPRDELVSLDDANTGIPTK